MSCFDELKLVCPVCGAEKVVQSKAGNCDMRTYTITDAPAAILAGVASDSPFTCEECGALYRLRVTVLSVIERC